MEPTPQGGSNAAKAIVAVLLIGVGLAGLAMSLCGGFFSGLVVYDFVMGNSTGEELDVLLVVVGGGSFVVGLLVIFLAVVAWKRTVSSRRP